jgi:hypothetical protein
LIVFSYSDGKPDVLKLEFIIKISQGYDVSEKQLLRIIKKPNKYSFYPSKSDFEKIRQIFDMVMMMLLDGKIYNNEILLCRQYAILLGFKDSVIDVMIKDIIDFSKEENNKNSSINQILNKYF